MSPLRLRAAARAAALLPAAVAATLVAAAATAAPLSLEQALDLAVARSQATRSARAGAFGAAEMARVAGRQPDPMLTAGIESLPATGSDRLRTGAEDMTMKRIALSQEWVGADKRAARQEAALAMQRRETTMEAVAAAETRVQTALAYIDTWFAAQALVLAEHGQRHAREQLETGKARAATAAGSGAEVLGLASALGVAEDDVAEQRQQHASATAALHRFTGEAGEDLAEPAPGPLPARAAYMAGHPLVVARQREIDVARRAAELAHAERRPNWTFEVAYGQRVGRSDLVSLGVSIPLPVAPAERQDREIAAKRALQAKAEAELAEAERAAAAEHAALASDAARLAERIERLRSAVLAPLAQRTAAMLAAYRSNQASLAMLFEARHAQTEAERRLLALRRDLAKARAQLAFKLVASLPAAAAASEGAKP